jgi:hypothetical protein
MKKLAAQSKAIKHNNQLKHKHVSVQTSISAGNNGSGFLQMAGSNDIQVNIKLSIDKSTAVLSLSNHIIKN